MVTEGQVTEGAEVPSTDIPAPEAAVEQAPVDLQTQLESLAVENAKLKNDVKSRDGVSRSRAEQDARMDHLGDEMSAFRKSNDALINALVNDDTANLAGTLNEINAETAQTRASGLFDRAYQSQVASADDALRDEGGEPLMDWKATELDSAVQLINEGYEQKDLTKVTAAVQEVHKIARSKEREKNKTAVANARKDVQEARTKALEDAGVNDIASPATSGAGTGTVAFGDRNLNELKTRDALQARRQALLGKVGQQ